ncbi:hypothetical protein IJH72_01240 [Candidatus Saccharibacteria bacterium]|nr:hypothetical protein [Candidatus Saccharibacteria bacterium]
MLYFTTRKRYCPNDERDNDTYAVAKLTDGRCWRIENLRLNTADSLDETK